MIKSQFALRWLALFSAASAPMLVPTNPVLAIPVFDSANYAQNLVIAARTLAQIDNQIRSLQNEASMLINMGKNLQRIDFPELPEIERRLRQIDGLIGRAQGIDFRVEDFERQYLSQFPDAGRAPSRDERLVAARGRLETAMAAFRQTMGLQGEIVDNVRQDILSLKGALERSQGAEGGLQATQATNQLLALTTKQQFQIQQLLAAQFRADAIEQAQRGQVAREAAQTTRRFLGDGRAYTPRP